MSRSEQVLLCLADGRFHSGEELAEQLDCSRSAIWKHIRQLRETTGLEVDAVTGRGYRLRKPLSLLQQSAVLQRLDSRQRAQLASVEVLGSVGSTNALAMENFPRMRGPAAAWFAEHQSAGRGRRGRHWVTPYAGSLAFSFAYRFELPLSALGGLSIAAGAMLAQVLERHGLAQHQLKWPNDLLWQSRKIAGVLLEVFGETEGPASAVIGIGINTDLPQHQAEAIDQPAVCLREAGVHVDRNALAGDLLAASLEMCERFADQGLKGFIEDWQRFDGCAGRQVTLSSAARNIQGLALGIADDGGLRLRIDEREQVFYGGEVSLRLGGAG